MFGVFFTDHPDLRRMLASQLRDAGYAAVEKTPGDDILGWSVETRPDVVIYDWIEEGGGALDFCRSFRADPRCAHSYLVMLIHGDPRDQVPRGLQAGANDFVAMPAQGANVHDDRVERREVRGRDVRVDELGPVDAEAEIPPRCCRRPPNRPNPGGIGSD